MSTKRLRIFVLFAFFGLCACAGRTLIDFPSLVDKGPLPLSATNPYLGTNLFLADEFRKSPELFNFLEGRGAPTAIDVQEEGLKRPTIRMFYTPDKQVYVAELQEAERGRPWIVRGPFAITRQEYKRLPKETPAGGNEAVFMYEGRQYRFHEAAPEAPQTVVALKVPEPPRAKPKPRPKSSKVIKAEGNVVTSDGKTSSAAPSTEASTEPLNFDQQAIRMTKGMTTSGGSMAERTPDGDVVHVVKKSDQTMKEIVQWYVGSLENAEEIAKKNGVKVDAPLPPGKRVILPGVLVKEFKQMP